MGKAAVQALLGLVVIGGATGLFWFVGSGVLDGDEPFIVEVFVGFVCLASAVASLLGARVVGAVLQGDS